MMGEILWVFEVPRRTSKLRFDRESGEDSQGRCFRGNWYLNSEPEREKMRKINTGKETEEKDQERWREFQAEQTACEKDQRQQEKMQLV